MSLQQMLHELRHASMDEIIGTDYFLLGRRVDFDESNCIEFKENKCITEDEVTLERDNNEEETAENEHSNPYQANGKLKKTWGEMHYSFETRWLENNHFKERFIRYQRRLPALRTVIAYLNSGRGGIILIGIKPDGFVKGKKLLKDQMMHIRMSLGYLLSRCIPPVPAWRYDVKFMPAVRKLEDVNRNIINTYYLNDSNNFSHVLKSQKECWCNKLTKELMVMGVSPPRYVIQIEVFPWTKQIARCSISSSPGQESENLSSSSDTDDEENIDEENFFSVFSQNFCPIYTTEEKKCYFKAVASVFPISQNNLYLKTLQEVQRYCLKEIESLDKRIEDLTFLIQCSAQKLNKYD